MFDIEKQQSYWINSAIDDIETADILFEKKKYKESLFFCHLCIEKALKAHYVKINLDFAPKTHKLSFLAMKSGLEIDDSTEELLGVLMTYQLEGRYPDYKPDIPSKDKVKEYINKTKQVLKWLKKQL